MEKAIPLAMVGGLAVLFLVLSGIYGGVPVPGGLGEEVAKVRIYVSGVWVHYGFPGIPDTVSIQSIDYVVEDWYNVLSFLCTSMYPVHGLGDKDDAKIVYEIYDDSSNKVKEGEVYFKLYHGWKTSFTISGLKPGTYNMKVAVYQKWEMLYQSSWNLKDTKDVTLDIKK